eukprot:7218629-Pyramimonas_sp.AAC.1
MMRAPFQCSTIRLASVELDAVQAPLLDVARAPREPPDDLAAGVAWSSAHRLLAAHETHALPEHLAAESIYVGQVAQSLGDVE